MMIEDAFAVKPSMMGLKTKLIASFVLLGIIPLLVLFSFTYSAYERVMNRNALNYLQNVTDDIERGVATYFHDIINIMELQNTYYVLQYVKLNNLGHRELATRYAYRITENLDYLRQTKSDLEDIVITTSGGIALSTIGEYYVNPATNAIYQRLKNSRQTEVYFVPTHLSRFGDDVFTVAEPIIEEDGVNLGFISEDVSDRLFRDATLGVNLGENGYILVVDQTGRIVFSPDNKQIGQSASSLFPIDRIRAARSGSFTTWTQGRPNLVSFRTDALSGWTFVSISPRDEIVSGIAQVRVAAVIVFAVAVLAFIVFFSLYLSTLLTDPIHRLRQHMQRVSENDLSARLNFSSHDEIGQLAASFNEMIRRIRNLMDEIVSNQKKIRMLEAQALQEQIQPHFIYNTLDSILSLLEMDDKERAIEMVENFGTFLRTSFANGIDTISVEEELTHVTTYLSIQRIRFGKSFEFDVEVDRAILPRRTPRLLLQPIVENSLLHGFEGKSVGGYLSIRGQPVTDGYELSVSDNGIGIDERHMCEILSALSDSSGTFENSRFFGLRNTHARIQLAFGPQYGLRVTSIEGQGTSVVAHLPG
ncbi:MAG TPA: sensor histidine kinase [Spirochaetia bacterium]|nr:sensor histidine kinase [Spirochaetia bacterium]